MNVSLTPELETLVQEKVASGMYHSASEVIREALRLLNEHDRLYELRRAELVAELQLGIDQLDRGEVVPLDIAATKARARARQKALEAEAAAEKAAVR